MENDYSYLAYGPCAGCRFYLPAGHTCLANPADCPNDDTSESEKVETKEKPQKSQKEKSHKGHKKSKKHKKHKKHK
jgi:hypothetical protein